MSLDHLDDIRLLKEEIEKFKKLANRDQESCFQRCKTRLENEFNELSSKKFDKYRTYALFLIAFLAFLGLPSLNFYVKHIVDNKVEEAIKKAEDKINSRAQDLEEKLKSTLYSYDAFIKTLSMHNQKLFVEFARSGDFETVKKLLKFHNVDPDVLDDDGKCALHWATMFEKEDVVDELLRRNAKLDCDDSKGFTPLFIALASSNLNIAKKLIEKGADLNRVNELYETPLHYTLLHLDKNIIETMIMKGADVNFISNQKGDNLLIEAIRNECDYNVLSLILKHTKNIDFKNLFGETALIVAVDESNKKIAKDLITKGASTQIAYEWSTYKNNKMPKEFINMLEK